MPTSAIDSLIFRDMFGSPVMREIWSDAFRTQKYLDWEAALARAQAKVGLIPQEAANEITRVCKVENIDFDAYSKETLDHRLPRARPCPPDCPSVPGGRRQILPLGGYDPGHYGLRHHPADQVVLRPDREGPQARDCSHGKALEGAPLDANARALQPATGGSDHLRLQDGSPACHPEAPSGAAR